MTFAWDAATEPTAYVLEIGRASGQYSYTEPVDGTQAEVSLPMGGKWFVRVTAGNLEPSNELQIEFDPISIRDGKIIVTAVPESHMIIFASTDLEDWQAIASPHTDQDALEWVDADRARFTQRFYVAATVK